MGPHDGILKIDGTPIVEVGVPPQQLMIDARLVPTADGSTVSYGEVFAGVLQDLGRARLVGQTTLGNVERPHTVDFDDGSRLWLAVERFDPLNSHAD